jgi:hydroxymethylglutaryl-CoA lyase
MDATRDVIIRDVTLRDGLQLVRAGLPTERKVALARTLLTAGLPQLEIGAIVRPDRVPTMADTEQVIAGLGAVDALDECWVLVPNLIGTRRAIAAGARNLQYVVSVSESHNLANMGCSVRRSLDGLVESLEYAADYNVTIQLGLATAFTCPFEGRTSVDAVRQVIAEEPLRAVHSVVLCDTIGQAVPGEVAELVGAARAELDAAGSSGTGLAFHGHDTWGMGVANTVAAVEAGVGAVDAALGGLGGCPFAPGASGNTPLEDVLYALRPAWLTHGSFHRLVRAGQELTSALGEPARSRTAEGARRSPAGHVWALGDPVASCSPIAL